MVPIGTIDAQLPIDQAAEQIQDQYLAIDAGYLKILEDHETLALVCDTRGIPVSWISVTIVGCNELTGVTIGEMAQPIDFANIIDAGAGIDVAIKAFARSRSNMSLKCYDIDIDHPVPLFVIEGTQIKGTVSYTDLTQGPNNLALRSFLLMLTLALEQWVLELLALDAKASFLSLPQGRREKAQQLHSQSQDNVDKPGNVDRRKREKKDDNGRLLCRMLNSSEK